MYDNNQAREFITALTGSDTSLVTFQVFFDPKELPTPAGLAATWTNTLDESLAFIDHKQSQMCGVYMCINETDGKGREESNIKTLRVMFADFDGCTEPAWKITPHLIQSRDETHGHAFWLIESDSVSFDEWSCLQKQIAMCHGTDEQVIDVTRVVRVPGSIHYKDPNNTASYKITSNITGTGHRYTVDEIRLACALPADLDAKLNQWATSRSGIDQGIGYEDNAQEVAKFTSFVTNAAHPAVEGSGSHELIRVASFGHDHGISLNNAIDILWQHYNPRCVPPWQDYQQDHFVEVCQRAYKYATSAAGCKTAKAGFQALPPLEEPACGWDNQAAQFVTVEPVITVQCAEQSTRADGYRITQDNAAIMSPSLTAKSSHYDFAVVFDGLKYEGKNIIRNGKQFYRFLGKSWEPISDEVIRAEIQRTFQGYRPSDSFTSGIFRVFCDHVNVAYTDNGIWLSDHKRDTSNLAVFQNGIVNLTSQENIIMKHTHDFFTFNELPFDFDLSATCPKWEQFLTSIWGDDHQLKRQLQQWMGYCLTTDSSLQKFALLMGKSRGGKGVITDIITAMVGEENVSSPSLAGLVKDSALHEMSTSSITLIPDAHNVNINIRDGVLSNLKAITGGDSLSYHEIYKGSRTTRFNTKIIMSTNNIPDFIDASGALVNRMIVFPFKKTFVGCENHGLRAELITEIAGITQWACEGLRDLRRCNGVFCESESGRIEKEEIREDMFPLSQYVTDSCDLINGTFTLVADLYNSYRLWASSNGISSPMQLNIFNKTLRNSALPINHDRNGVGRGFNGISVKSNSNMIANVVNFPR